MSMALFMLVLSAAWCAVPPTGKSVRRLTPSSAHPKRGGLDAFVEDPRRRAVVCMVASALLVAVASGPALAGVGAPAGLALSWWIGRFEPPSVTKAREEVNRDLPMAVDLLAACLLVGRPVDQALRVVGGAMGGALQTSFESVQARLALGADPVQEWRRVEQQQPQLASFARSMARSLESGAPLVDGLGRLGEDLRRARRTALQMRARNVGVKAAAPLAACFLPAFMVIGVVPTVAGAFAHLVL
ncbi:MAG: type II secretion system F family protein [Nocardioidaceae bacterium]